MVKKYLGGKDGKVPSAEQLSKMSRAELVKRLPPHLQKMWAALSPKDKDKWERRFREKFTRGR
jgi:hypothetical protein